MKSRLALAVLLLIASSCRHSNKSVDNNPAPDDPAPVSPATPQGEDKTIIQDVSEIFPAEIKDHVHVLKYKAPKGEYQVGLVPRYLPLGKKWLLQIDGSKLQSVQLQGGLVLPAPMEDIQLPFVKSETFTKYREQIAQTAGVKVENVRSISRSGLVQYLTSSKDEIPFHHDNVEELVGFNTANYPANDELPVAESLVNQERIEWAEDKPGTPYFLITARLFDGNTQRVGDYELKLFLKGNLNKLVPDGKIYKVEN